MRITESKLRRIVRSIIKESRLDVHDDDIYIKWDNVENSIRDDEYYNIDEEKIMFESLPYDSPRYEEYRERFEDRADAWLFKKGLSRLSSKYDIDSI